LKITSRVSNSNHFASLEFDRVTPAPRLRQRAVCLSQLLQLVDHGGNWFVAGPGAVEHDRGHVVVNQARMRVNHRLEKIELLDRALLVDIHRAHQAQAIHVGVERA
jgi:hypothetical protein